MGMEKWGEHASTDELALRASPRLDKRVDSLAMGLFLPEKD